MTDTYFLTGYKGAEIYIKREDLQPFSFGGNKLRIAECLFGDILGSGCDAVISYGSAESNLNRVIAHMARRKGVKCYVIIKKDPEENGFMPFNEQMVRASGAEIFECSGSNVREKVEEVMALSEDRGENWYYVYGSSSGTGNEYMLIRGSLFIFDEILAYEKTNSIFFDHIFHASGTGATQSGLIAGSIMSGDYGRREICGISTARSNERGKASIKALLKDFSRGRLPYVPEDDDISFTDAYVSEGYGRSSAEIDALIDDMMKQYAIPLDPVYTAKAYYGMLREIDRRGIKGKVLFIHTGGTPLYFDYLRKRAAADE